MTDKNFSLVFNDGYVLVAEDSLVQAKRIKRFFENRQIPAKVCKHGAEAYEMAKIEKPVLIISDIVMPVMDGYAFCSKVKQEPDLKDIPFILLTSLSDPLDIIRGLQAGADNFITKPYDDDYLMARINYLIANRFSREMGAGDMSIEILFQNQKFRINSDKKQILDLLLSVYEAAVNRNEHLIKAQRELEQANQNLLEANRELDAFARTVSHDLRSPLTGIIGYADILKSTYSHALDEGANDFLDGIIRTGRKMAQLISDLLDFSRSAREDIAAQEVDLSAMAEEVAGELRQMTYKADYSVNIDNQIKVYADPKMMRVMLHNLIGNALKYSQKEPSPQINIGAVDKNGKQVVFIRDNGVGFEMDKANNLFSPFIRLHFNQEFQGTGVGLSTVKRIIERHGGAIWFESAPGEGTTFYFTIN